MKFKFGDKVKIVGDSTGHRFSTGKIVVIIDTDEVDAKRPYLGTDDEGNSQWLAEADIELATPTTEPDTPSKLAALLGVKDDEPFNVVDEDGDTIDICSPWYVKNNILVDCEGDARGIPADLLTGKYKVAPFKPNGWHEDDSMYYIDAYGKICLSDFSRTSDTDVALVLSGNAFHTKAEAEENQPRISAEIIEKLGEC